MTLLLWLGFLDCQVKEETESNHLVQYYFYKKVEFHKKMEHNTLVCVLALKK
jgi:hypothetical protein